MASLSEEIQRLSELFANGVLSEEEFKAAKEVTIKSYTSHATTAPQEEELEKNVLEATRVHTRFPHVNISEFSDDFDGQTKREKAYALMETILRNILQFPEEEKYRRLRLGNAVLQSQLFSVSGVLGFLHSVGFVRHWPDDGEKNDILHLSGGLRRPLLEEGLAAINFLRNRDQETLMSNRNDCMRLRRNLRLEVRRERCEKAKAVGELRSYIVREFCSDDGGDGLYSSQKNLEKLETILTNVLHHPAEAKYRRLRLSNPAVRATVLQQRGGLEVLLECAGGEVVEEGEETLILLREGVVTEGKLRCALQTVEAARSAVSEVQNGMDQRVREEAREAVRLEARRERERMHRQQRRTQQALEGAEEESESTDEVPGRRRVTIAEALRFLMGENGAEEEENA